MCLSSLNSIYVRPLGIFGSGQDKYGCGQVLRMVVIQNSINKHKQGLEKTFVRLNDWHCREILTNSRASYLHTQLCPTQ